MGGFFYSVLPLVWLVAAALVALLLYRTSKALVRADNIAGLPAKEVRITGSVAIFVIVYVLLWQTTKTMAVLDQDRDRIGVPRASWEEAGRLVERIEAGTVRLAGCAGTPMPLSACPVDIDALQRDAEDLKRAMTLPESAPEP